MGPRGRRARRRGLVVGAAVGSSMAKRSAADNQQQDAQAQGAAPAQSDMASQLQELQNLKDQGILTEEEFQAKKKQILGI
jgi:membrane protease subunit (stomatin/prohibitin family)